MYFDRSFRLIFTLIFFIMKKHPMTPEIDVARATPDTPIFKPRMMSKKAFVKDIRMVFFKGRMTSFSACFDLVKTAIIE